MREVFSKAWHQECLCRAFFWFSLWAMLYALCAMRRLYGEFNKAGTIKGLLRFHHFKPALNGFLYICKGFFMSFPLRETARKRRNLRDIINRFVFFDHDVQFHKNLQILFTIKHVFLLKSFGHWFEMFLFTLRLTPYALRSRFSLCAMLYALCLFEGGQ